MRKTTLSILLLVSGIAFVFVMKLIQHRTGLPFSWEEIFSEQNIKETLVLIGIAVSIVAAVWYLSGE